MSYLRENLSFGEQVVLEARITTIGVWLWGIVFGLPAAILIISGVVERSGAAFLVGILLGLPILYPYLRYRRTELGVTDRRIVEKTGILSDHTRETTFDKIQTVSFNRSLLGKMFNYGTVIVQSAATFGAEGINDVKNPKAVRDAILHQMELHRARLQREQAEAIAKVMIQQQKS